MSEENILKAELKGQADKTYQVARVLIVTGLLLLSVNLLGIHLMDYLWPGFIVGIGVALAWPSYKSTRDNQSKLSVLAVPGAMTIALGLLLFLMNLVDHYESMAYSWTLLLAAGAFGLRYTRRFDNTKANEDKLYRFIRTMILVFMGLAVFFELFVFQSLGAWWPLLVIGLGLYMYFKNKRSES